MFVNLKKISELLSADDKVIKVSDILIDGETGQVSQFIARNSWFPLRHEVLIPNCFINLEEPFFLDDIPNFRFTFEKKTLNVLRDRGKIKTFTEEAEKMFLNSDSLLGLEEPTTMFLRQKNTDPIALKEKSLISLESVCGFFVESPDRILGKLYDLIVDTETWLVEYAVLDVLSGLKKDLRIIPFSSLTQISWVPGVISAEMAEDSLEPLPDYPGAMYADERWFPRVAVENMGHQKVGG